MPKQDRHENDVVEDNQGYSLAEKSLPLFLSVLFVFLAILKPWPFLIVLNLVSLKEREFKLV